jgi:hypothetical protein
MEAQAGLQPLLDGDLAAQPPAELGVIRAKLSGSRLVTGGTLRLPFREEVVEALVLREIELVGVQVVTHGKSPRWEARSIPTASMTGVTGLH